MPRHRPLFDLRLALADAPSVWRKLRISSGATLPRAQRVFCVLFGWPGGRPYAFRADGLDYESENRRDPRVEVRLRQLLPDAGASLDFEYGEPPWHVTVHVERVLPPPGNPVPPECLAGEGEPPHVDGGDVWRWQEERAAQLVDLLAAGTHGAAANRPTVGVNVAAINAELAHLP